MQGIQLSCLLGQRGFWRPLHSICSPVVCTQSYITKSDVFFTYFVSIHVFRPVESRMRGSDWVWCRCSFAISLYWVGCFGGSGFISLYTHPGYPVKLTNTAIKAWTAWTACLSLIMPILCSISTGSLMASKRLNWVAPGMFFPLEQITTRIVAYISALEQPKMELAQPILGRLPALAWGSTYLTIPLHTNLEN